MLRLFAAGTPAPRLQDPDLIDRSYRRLRVSILITLVASYGISYTARLGLGVIKDPLLEEGIFTATELGWIGSGFFWGYAAGKLINGFIADRVNVRIFIPTGLAISAIANLLMGGNTLVVTAVALWVINGWFQGFGNPANVISLTHWFSFRERGTVYGIWSAAHAIGEGLTFIGTGALVAVTMWRFAFWGPGVLCLVTAAVALFTLRDRPETLGLPPVGEWKGDHSGGAPGGASPQRGRQLLRTQLSLLRLPVIWVIGLASMSMYATRYAINMWGVLYLQKAHDMSNKAAASLVGLNAIVGIGGCIAYGVLSDRLFKSRRPPLTLIFGLVEIGALLVIFTAPRGNITVLALGFVVYGFTLSGLLAVLGGLFAVDVAPKSATGATMGVIGVFSYFGAAIQDVVSGMLIDSGSVRVDGEIHYDFSVAIVFWVGASVLSMVLAATLWRVRASDPGGN